MTGKHAGHSFSADSITLSDALSRIFSEEPTTRPTAETILPPNRIFGMVTWEIEGLARTALWSDPGPGNGPPKRLFVPQPLRSKVLDWAHSSLFTCHPGIHRSLSFIRRHFWWPSTEADTRKFIAACCICSRNKANHSPPAGLLHPLLIPSRPWSHIAFDFITGLPPSNGNTTILTIIDRFSKAAHFIPLPKLPSSAETTELLVQHVLAPRFVGPYTVRSRVNPAAVCLDLPHSHSYVSGQTSSLSPPIPAPPPPRVLKDGDQVWTVREILQVRRRGRGWVYLEDWEGYGPGDRSWVPASYIADPSLIEDFYRTHPEAPRSSSGVLHKGGVEVLLWVTLLLHLLLLRALTSAPQATSTGVLYPLRARFRAAADAQQSTHLSVMSDQPS
ncbi:uncharacterized protein [Nerophis lumbriciformis]|uniref:uncharacterized protein n=1 Tax=Nerophis lumbriciformis TaxID=546530 RepID=UPI002AE0A3E1|nr:uncharacterized protein LOC133617329 [Nerophis lumbriciformis]